MHPSLTAQSADKTLSEPSVVIVGAGLAGLAAGVLGGQTTHPGFGVPMATLPGILAAEAMIASVC